MTIQNAKDRNISESSLGLPDVGAAVKSFFQAIVITVISKQLIDGYAQEIEDDIETMGCVQAASAEELGIAKDGERSWDSAMVHTGPEFDVPTDTVFVLKGKRYRVLSRKNYAEYGYIEYGCKEDFTAQ